MSSPVGYPQRNAYPMFSSTSQGDVPVGKNGTNLIPVMANVIPSSGGILKIMAGDVDVTGQISGVEYADPYSSARPPSLTPINSIKMRSYCTDGVFHYGVALPNYNSVYRMRESDAAPTETYAFPAGNQVYSLYYELGVLFAIAYNTTTSLYSLYRSTDGGSSFSEVHKIGIGSDGQHYPGTAPFIRGFCSGRLRDGREVVICTTYNIDQVETAVLPKDRRYAVISYDKGATWSVLWELNVGVKNTRHFHGVK